MFLYKFVLVFVVLAQLHVIVDSQKGGPGGKPTPKKPIPVPVMAPVGPPFEFPPPTPAPTESPTKMKPKPKPKPTPKGGPKVKPAPLAVDVLLESAQVGLFSVTSATDPLLGTMTCQEACSYLFGGDQLDYVGSVQSSAVTFTCNGVTSIGSNNEVGLTLMAHDFKQCDSMEDIGCSTSLFAPPDDSPMKSCSVVPVNYCYNGTTLGLRVALPDLKPTPKSPASSPALTPSEASPASQPTLKMKPTPKGNPQPSNMKMKPTPKVLPIPKGSPLPPDSRVLTITVTVVIEFNGTSSTETTVLMCQVVSGSVADILFQIISLPIANASTICPVVSRTITPALMISRNNMRGTGALSIRTAEDATPSGLFELQVEGSTATTEEKLQAIQAELDAAVQSGQATALLQQYLIDNGPWNEMTAQWKVSSMSVGLAAAPTYAPTSASESSSSNGSSPSTETIAAAAAGAALGVALLVLGGWWVISSSSQRGRNRQRQQG